jgi:hypothetical protein
LILTSDGEEHISSIYPEFCDFKLPFIPTASSTRKITIEYFVVGFATRYQRSLSKQRAFFNLMTGGNPVRKLLLTGFTKLYPSGYYYFLPKK